MGARRIVALAAVGVVVALAVAPGATAKPPPKPPPTTGALTFAGRTWTVKSSSGKVGPGPNYFSASNAFVDSAGNLHLKITKGKRGRWDVAEVVSTDTVGYGTYRWTVATDVANLDPNVVLGMFTWSDVAAYNNQELDVEVARWGTAIDRTNAQFVVQPATDAHLHRFYLPPFPPTTHVINWAEGHANFQSLATYSGGQDYAGYFDYAGTDVPVATGDAHARMNLWLFNGLAPTDGQPVEVVFSDFRYCAVGAAC